MDEENILQSQFLDKNVAIYVVISYLGQNWKKLEILFVETNDKFNVCLQEPKSKHQVLQQYSKMYVQ